MDQQVPLRRHGVTAIDGALALIVVLLLVQIWLLSASLDEFLAGHPETAIPGAIFSGILFLASVGLYWFIVSMDKDLRK
jgi:hypothetical protein